VLQPGSDMTCLRSLKKECILKVSVAGSGYASLVIGACLAEMGNIVTHYLNDSDLDPDNLPFHEPGLANLISSNSSSRRLVYSNEPATSVSEADVVFIALEHDASVDEKQLLWSPRFHRFWSAIRLW